MHCGTEKRGFGLMTVSRFLVIALGRSMGQNPRVRRSIYFKSPLCFKGRNQINQFFPDEDLPPIIGAGRSAVGAERAGERSREDADDAASRLIVRCGCDGAGT